ncbi:MAG: MotA/TolQ/ExbB proton channel family protein [Gammaproteobacteria bacterium]|nr:MotA/TolQ/ExbB proton channel family protein [Gammaproteobacteria bacterium]
MKHNPTSEFLFQLIALFVAIIIVHTVYVTVVWPGAERAIAAERAQQALGEGFDAQRSFFVVIKDYEQESCFVLMLWATAIMGYKARHVLRERRHLARPLLSVEPGRRILPEDSRAYARPLQALPEQEREYLLPRALLAALQRFGSTGNIQDVAGAVHEACDLEAAHLDAELSMIRYIVWAIPSIGFIGTVRGIGQALGQAHRAVEGDIVGVTMSLGVAFNSTFIALVISLFIMFLMHQLQLLQERLVFDAQSYCDVNLLRHLAVR